MTRQWWGRWCFLTQLHVIDSLGLAWHINMMLMMMISMKTMTLIMVILMTKMMMLWTKMKSTMFNRVIVPQALAWHTLFVFVFYMYLYLYLYLYLCLYLYLFNRVIVSQGLAWHTLPVCSMSVKILQCQRRQSSSLDLSKFDNIFVKKWKCICQDLTMFGFVQISTRKHAHVLHIWVHLQQGC